MRFWSAAVRLVLCGSSVMAGAALDGCKREERRFTEWPPTATAEGAVREIALQPGRPGANLAIRSAYEENAYAVSQGKQLYGQFNCSGCHFHGGGGIGPPLMDEDWIYGSQPENIYQSIVEGRPNGMPSFGGKLSAQQVWQLASYVRSMSGLLRKDVAPGRDDHMQVTAQEQQTDKARPKQSTPPPSTTRP
jgi:cytochrome c oxidase cbb3-type subunit III